MGEDWFLKQQWQSVKKTRVKAENIDNQLHHDWIKYFEGIIDEDGSWYDLRGSHQTALEGLCAEKLSISIEELRKRTPPQYYSNYDYYLLGLSHSIAVRFGFSQGNAPSKQAISSYNKLCKLEKIKDVNNWV